MISLKTILTESNSIPQYVFHVTPKANLNNIKAKGLLPNKPKDFEDETAVYLFNDKASAEDAIMNWMDDRYDEDVSLVLLTINTSGLNLIKTLDDQESWEYKSYQPIPWKNIVKIEPI